MRQEVLTTDEYNKLIDLIPTLNTSRQVAIGLGLLCGLRPRETLGLTINDCFIDGDIRRQLTIRPEISKNRLPRTLPIPTNLQILLGKHYMHCERTIGSQPKEDWPLLPGTGQRGYSSVWLGQTCQRIGRYYLKRKMSPYTLRHTFATRLLKVSNLRVVQEALGHVSVTSTQIYTHVSQNDLEVAMTIASRRQLPYRSHDEASTAREATEEIIS
jgi:integrase